MVTNTTTPQWRGLLSISAAAIAWGAGGATAAVLFRTSGLGPLAVSFWRLAVATLILSATRATRPAAASATTSRRVAVATGVGLAVYQTAYFAAVHQAGLALGTLITLGAGPVFIAVGASVVLGERLDRRGKSALGTALAGLVLLVGGSLSSGPGPILGVGLALLSATGFSAVTLFTRAAGGGGTTVTSFSAGLVCLLPLALGEGIWPRTAHLTSVVPLMVFLGVVSTLLAYRWYFVGLATIPAATASVIVLLEPVTAALLAVVLLGEHLTANVAIGSSLLLAAVALLAKNTSR
jgi:DME family drug/metabolite transporter